MSEKTSKKKLARVGLLFGSFDPVHRGHLRLGRAGLKALYPNFYLKEIWYVLSPQNPLKKQTGLSAAAATKEERRAMLELALKGKETLKVNCIEFERPAPHYTAETLRRLEEKFPHTHFALLLGEDNLRLFPLWKEYRWIAEHYPLIIYPRNRQPQESQLEPRLPLLNLKAQRGELYFLNHHPKIEISSTALRRAYRKTGDALSRDLKKFLPAAVKKYVELHSLYR